MHRVSLGTRLAMLFAACSAVVSLLAGILFSSASERHFIELDQQLLQPRLASLRNLLAMLDTEDDLAQHLASLREALGHQAELALRIRAANGSIWFDSRDGLPGALEPLGLSSVHADGVDYRVLAARLRDDQPRSPQLALFLDITHHQHFLQHMQRLIWSTVGLSALATALLGAWAVRRGLRPLRQMSRITANVSARSLTTRLPVTQMPEELAHLGETLNAMLERLEEAFQRLSAFSADIAHELRTPLSNLLTHTQVTLTRTRNLEEYREALHDNLEELQWMAQLVNDMLYLAKADHGLLTPSRQKLTLHDELDALLEYHALLAEDRGITLARNGQAWLHGDRHMLRRAFSNLLDNALRFTPPAGTVRVSCDTSAQRVRIVIANTGPAIEPSLLPRLFDRFFRADPARREGRSEHAGLGLAITRSIIQAHAGTITAECDAGWTCFVIELPVP